MLCCFLADPGCSRSSLLLDLGLLPRLLFQTLIYYVLCSIIYISPSSLSIFLFSPPLSFLLRVSDSQCVCLTLGQIHVCFSVVAGKTAAWIHCDRIWEETLSQSLKQFSLIQERYPDKSCWERFVLLSNCFMKHFYLFSFSNLSVLLLLDHKPCNLR